MRAMVKAPEVSIMVNDRYTILCTPYINFKHPVAIVNAGLNRCKAVLDMVVVNNASAVGNQLVTDRCPCGRVGPLHRRPSRR